MRLYRPFFFSKLIYPGALFRLNTGDMTLYLTFDDGPSPESTPRILKILDHYNIKATFFCNGREAEKYPGLIRMVISKGHAIGNHGYRHLNGWKSNLTDYTDNAERAALHTSPDLFRPPYGRLRLSQYKKLVKKYSIVMWDLMAYDFDRKMNGIKVLNILKKKSRPGSIILLHDKPESTVFSFLEEFIKYAGEEGYIFKIVPDSFKK